MSERKERRRDWKVGKPHHPTFNSTSTQSKIHENYHPKSSTGEQTTEDARHSSNLPSIIGTCPDMCPGLQVWQPACFVAVVRFGGTIIDGRNPTV
ncbi:hypothetical protein ACLOJK_000342 [Asimina triloba]